MQFTVSYSYFSLSPLLYLETFLGAHTARALLFMVHWANMPLNAFADSVCGVLIYMQHNLLSSQILGGQCSKNLIQHSYLNNAGATVHGLLRVFKRNWYVITSELHPWSWHESTHLFSV